MHNYFYYPGAGGVRFCYAKQATFVCRYEDGPPIGLTDEATALGFDAERLKGMWHRNHQTFSGRLRMADGKLTTECRACGYKLDRKGFRVWRERAFRSIEDLEAAGFESRSSDGINLHMAGVIIRHVGEGDYLATKKEAIAWATENADVGA